MNARFLFVSAVAVGALWCSSLSAGVVHFVSDPTTTTNSAWTGASLAGSVDYTHTGGNSGQLVFSMTNTTPGSIGGFLTGFLFTITSADENAAATLSSSSVNGVGFSDTGAQTITPFGSFDGGAAVGGNWQGGGSPSQGLGVALSAVFTFTVSATDASSLTTLSFMGDGTEIALRFRGLPEDNGEPGSDKLLVTVVPLPSGVLAGGAMLGLGLGVRRLRK